MIIIWAQLININDTVGHVQGEPLHIDYLSSLDIFLKFY